LVKKKKKIVKLGDVESLNAVQFHVCNKLRMVDWQYDKLSIEEKILKWTSRNPDKELIFEINRELIFKSVRQNKSTIILISRSEFPTNYDMGNPHNRWIHNDPIVRTQEQENEDEKKIEIETKEEFEKIQSLIESIRNKCSIQIVELSPSQ